jgi:hypothetical protein
MQQDAGLSAVEFAGSVSLIVVLLLAEIFEAPVDLIGNMQLAPLEFLSSGTVSTSSRPSFSLAIE